MTALTELVSDFNNQMLTRPRDPLAVRPRSRTTIARTATHDKPTKPQSVVRGEERFW